MAAIKAVLARARCFEYGVNRARVQLSCPRHGHPFVHRQGPLSMVKRTCGSDPEGVALWPQGQARDEVRRSKGTMGTTLLSRIVPRFLLIGVLLGLLIEIEARPESDFKVTLLGTGAPIPLPNRFGPSTLVEAGGQKLLFDAGRGVPIRLRQINVPVGKVDALPHPLSFRPHNRNSGCMDDGLGGWRFSKTNHAISRYRPRRCEGANVQLGEGLCAGHQDSHRG